jgi:cytidylate kinase
MPAERIQKLIAQSGLVSRRAAEELIEQERVTVDGDIAQLGQRADPSRHEILVDGRPLAARGEQVHLAVHKPRGMLSSARDERGRQSVVRLVPRDQAERYGRLWPAGRLDVESEGLMILTNDGEWANRVLHPRYGVAREYAALVDPEPDAAALRELRAGVEVEDGPARLLAARRAAPPREVRREPGDRGTWLRIQVGEGRKREVRRLFEAVGSRVQRLARVAIGPLTISGLEAGEWRTLGQREVQALAGREQEPMPKPEDRRADASVRKPTLAVAIDGPSGAGKSTVGHALAVRIGANFVDTGLMYRALTLAALEQGVDPDDGAALGRLARRSQIHVRRPRPGESERFETVLLGRRDVTELVRTPRIDRLVSAVSRHAEVRTAMIGVQRTTARQGDTVMVGRDIGTVVLPDATLKVFLTASTTVRAERRAAEMGRPNRVNEYLSEIERRDAADSSRAVAPLRKARGALVLDTGELDVEACVERIVAALDRRGRSGARAQAVHRRTPAARA